MNLAFVFAFLLALAVGGLAYGFLGGDDNVVKRRRALTKPSRKASDAVADRAAKKKQIAESLADLDKKAKSRKADLQTRIEQAGWSIRKGPFLMIFVGMAIVTGGLTTAAAAETQPRILPYISPSGSLISSIRAPSGSLTYSDEPSMWA